MHIAEVVTIAKSLPLLRLNTYKSLILSYSADYRRIFMKNRIRARAGIDCFSTPKHRYPKEYERTSFLFSTTIEGQDS